jgi:hypothetical protein
MEATKMRKGRKKGKIKRIRETWKCVLYTGHVRVAYEQLPDYGFRC